MKANVSNYKQAIDIDKLIKRLLNDFDFKYDCAKEKLYKCSNDEIEQLAIKYLKN